MDITNLDAEYSDFIEVNKNNLQQIEKKALKIGYAEGVQDGSESVFQKGFDKGYRDGLTMSFDLEKFRSFFNHINASKINNENLAREKEVFNQLSNMDLKCLQINHSTQTSVRREYVEETLKEFSQKLPLATRLLHVPSNTKKIL